MARWEMKRLMRHRLLVMGLIAAPLVPALAYALFPNQEITRACVWACPPVCALLTFGVMWLRRSVDRVCGLLDGLRSSPLSEGEMDAAMVIAGAAVFALEMGVVGLVIWVRF
jgi:hypothetical protein